MTLKSGPKVEIKLKCVLCFGPGGMWLGKLWVLVLTHAITLK